MEKILNLTFASSLTKLCELNSSFDRGILRVCYPGLNRNNSFIDKQTIERCIKTMYNCPVVCNYDRETDSIGGHDIEVVKDKNGELSLVNLTTPIGVVPESANWEWQDITEADGTVNEYLCVEVLLWKRQEAYKKIKEDGVTSQSMEINVNDGAMIDGVFHINDFEFTAFTIIGVEPCFESACIETFSKQDFKQQLAEMMQELKESNSLVNAFNKVDNKPKNSTEGGKKILDAKMELVAKYEIDIEALDFNIEDYTIEELTEKFEAMTNKDEGEPKDDKFALMNNVIDEIIRELSSITIQCDWGERIRYHFVDCDFENSEVYVWDTKDWLLYGFMYSMDGDSVVIDYDSKKRKKYIIADFEEGSADKQDSPFMEVFSLLEQKISDNKHFETKYQSASQQIDSMEQEINELRQFKDDTLERAETKKREDLFAQFEDLVGVEEFEHLRENNKNYDFETLEEKCFAIRGKVGVVSKFNHTTKHPKLKVTDDNISTDTEPYGGVFVKYNIVKK